MWPKASNEKLPFSVNYGSFTVKLTLRVLRNANANRQHISKTYFTTHICSITTWALFWNLVQFLSVQLSEFASVCLCLVVFLIFVALLSVFACVLSCRVLSCQSRCYTVAGFLSVGPR